MWKRNPIFALNIVLLHALLLLLTGCSGRSAFPGEATEQLRQTLIGYLNESVDFSIIQIVPELEIPEGKQQFDVFDLPKMKLKVYAEIGVANNSPVPLMAKEMNVRLFTSSEPFGDEPLGDPLSSGSVDDDIMIPAGQEATIPVIIEVPAERVGRELINRIRGNRVHYRLDTLFNFSWRGVEAPFNVVLEEGVG